MKNKEDLIYDLIFSDNTEYDISVGEYISDIYKYDRFIDETKVILKKSRVYIVNEKIVVDAKSVVWKIKVNK